MATWKRGRICWCRPSAATPADLLPFVVAGADETHPAPPRTAVYAVAEPGDTIAAGVLHNLKHNQVLHEHNVILTVSFHDVPLVPPTSACRCRCWHQGFWRVG